MQGFPTSVILECATARLAKSLQEKVANRDMELLTSGHGRSIFLRAMQALKDNRVLMTQCDEVDAWRKRKSHTISLFGRELFFDNTIDVLSHRSGAPVVAAFLKRTGHNRYTLFCEDVSVQRETGEHRPRLPGPVGEVRAGQSRAVVPVEEVGGDEGCIARA